MTANPLLQYKKPGAFVKLPSGGRFYKNKPTLTADGDIEVLPMNAMDELQMMNPDGLINNESLFTVLQHVVPSISDPKEISNPDLDVLLIAMRMVTYGVDMDISTTCSKCSHEDTFTIPLTDILSNISDISHDTKLTIDEFDIEIHPYTLYSQIKLNQYIMNVQRAARKLQALDNDNSDDANSNEFRAELANSVNISAQELFHIAAGCIVSIAMPNGEVVTSAEFIIDWLKTIPAPKYDILKTALEKLSTPCINRSFEFVCTNDKCKHENKMEVDFDPANFFAIS